MTETANKTMVGGTHYLDMGVQPWDVVATWPAEQQIGFFRGNAVKYLMRMGTKDEQLQEVRKAQHYVQKLLEVLGVQEAHKTASEPDLVGPYANVGEKLSPPEDKWAGRTRFGSEAEERNLALRAALDAAGVAKPYQERILSNQGLTVDERNWFIDKYCPELKPGNADLRYDLFYHALNYRTAFGNEAAQQAWEELEACHKRLVERAVGCACNGK